MIEKKRVKWRETRFGQRQNKYPVLLKCSSWPDVPSCNRVDDRSFLPFLSGKSLTTSDLRQGKLLIMETAKEVVGLNDGGKISELHPKLKDTHSAAPHS